MPRIGEPALKIANLRVDYGKFTAVDDLSLELSRGEIFGLAGPNGAGKTSTMRVVASLLEPTYGEIEILGYDLFESPEAVHGLLGYMPDLAPVVPDLRVWEFLDLYAASHGLRGTQRRERVDRCLELVDLADQRNVFGKGLSRGMTQRVVLAKTLLHRPRLLLLDEPASGMDPIARRDLRMVLERLAAEGATIIISSHILSELSDMCSSVGIMHQGRLLRHGTLRSVLRNLEAEQSHIQLDVVGDATAAVTMLRGWDEVDDLSVDDQRISFILRGDEAVRARLLKALIDRGAVISAFVPRETGIESVLMDVIRSVDG
ncbi:MAG: ABC transporter ATP-binding protein [Gammaproteobacteria bacterium]|jgi:ABC-2 type transport system ATP-binding protein